MKIKSGDKVLMLVGKDKGKIGKVMKVFPKKNKVVVEGLNLCKKHYRPRREGEKGEIVEISRPVDVSNVALICPNCEKPTRVGYRFENGKKVRYCKKCKGKV